MPCPSFAFSQVLAALLATSAPAMPSRVGEARLPGDSAAEAVIADELRALYRDVDAGNWSAMLDHFLPAKVTARWAPPVDREEWIRLAPPAAAPPTRSGACGPRASVAVVGDWARVLSRRCAAPVDEAWLLRVSGRWRIVRLVLASPPTREHRDSGGADVRDVL